MSWRLVDGLALGVIGFSAVVRDVAACSVLEELCCDGGSGSMSDVSLRREGGEGMELVDQVIYESVVLQVADN